MSKNSVKIGIGTSIKSTKVVQVPILWKNVAMTLKVNVIEHDVPFFLGKEALTWAEAEPVRKQTRNERPEKTH